MPSRSPEPVGMAQQGASNAMHATEMTRTHSHVQGNTNDALIQCIKKCYGCAHTCTSCADACLGEAMVQQLIQCIRLSLDCADICTATGSIASRRTGVNEEVIRQMLVACETACRRCGEECGRHAEMHEHCQVCAEACQRCEQACADALWVMFAR